MSFSLQTLAQKMPGPKQLFPFLGWIGELRDKKVLSADIIAGITVALVLVPQSMAYAQLAGLEAYYGLYAAFLPGMVAALFGSSRQMSTGPVAMVSLVTATALEQFATSPETYVTYAIMLSLIVGVVQMALGLLRMGVMVNFLSHPVVVGFTNAAAIIIGTSQLSKLFGVQVERAEHHYETVWNVLVEMMSQTHMATLLMAILSLALMFLMKKYLPKLPNVLIAVAITTVISWAIGYEDMGGRVVGVIPEGLPTPEVPDFDWDVALNLLATAIVISMLAFMETISIAKAMAVKTRQKVDANQELVARGMSNVVGSFFQSYPVSGSFSRSAVNLNAGAITGFSAIVSGAIVAITLLFLTPLLYHLPQATLAAVIIMAVISLIRFKPIVHAFKVQRHDGIVAIVTFVLTLVMAPSLQWGIGVGVLLSLGLYLFRTMKPRVVLLARHPDGTLRDAELHGLQTCDSISLIRFDGSLFFANTGYFEDVILERAASKPHLKYIIIDAEGINEIDASGEAVLLELANRLKQAGIQIVFARAKKQIMDIFERVGIVDEIGAKYFPRLRTHAFEMAWRDLGCSREQCPLTVSQPLMEEQDQVVCEAVRKQLASVDGKA